MRDAREAPRAKLAEDACTECGQPGADVPHYATKFGKHHIHPLCLRVWIGEAKFTDPVIPPTCPNHPLAIARRDEYADWHFPCNCTWSKPGRYGITYTDLPCPSCKANGQYVGNAWFFTCGHYRDKLGTEYYKLAHTPKQCTCGLDIPRALDGEPWCADRCPRCITR